MFILFLMLPQGALACCRIAFFMQKRFKLHIYICMYVCWFFYGSAICSPFKRWRLRACINAYLSATLATLTLYMFIWRYLCKYVCVCSQTCLPLASKRCLFAWLSFLPQCYCYCWTLLPIKWLLLLLVIVAVVVGMIVVSVIIEFCCF